MTSRPAASGIAPPAGWSMATSLLAAALGLPALLALAVTIYMAADFPPFHLLDEAAHLHAVARIASGSLPRMGEAFDADVLGLALPERPPGALPPKRGVERFYLLHPPGYHLLAAPWYALGGGDAVAGLRWVRAAGGGVVVLLALAVPIALLALVPWRSSPPLRRVAGALVALLPLALPGVLFTAAFVTNHQLDVVAGTALGIVSGAALSLGGAARTRAILAAGVAAGLLAATRLNDAWAVAVPLALALVAPGGAWGRDMLAAIAGLVPGAAILAYWLTWNLATSHSLLPRQLTQVLTLPLTGVAQAEPPDFQPLLLATQLALGQCTPPRTLDGALAIGLWLALPAWLALGWRSASRAERAAMALAAWASLANLGLLLASIGQGLGRYLLPSLCFSFAIAGATFAASPLRGREGEPPGDRAAARVAAGALAVLFLSIASWVPSGRLTPPAWGVPQRFASRTPLAGIFGLPPPPPPPPSRPMVVDGEDVTPPSMRRATPPAR